MPPDSTVQERASDVVNAIVAANTGEDRLQVAMAIAFVSMLVAGADAETRAGLAWCMRRCAEKLDHDVIESVTLQ